MRSEDLSYHRKLYANRALRLITDRLLLPVLCQTLLDEAGVCSPGRRPGQDDVEDELLPMHTAGPTSPRQRYSLGEGQEPIQLGINVVAGAARKVLLITSNCLRVSGS